MGEIKIERSFFEWTLAYEFDSYRDLVRLLDRELNVTLRQRQEDLRAAAESEEDEELHNLLLTHLYGEEEQGEEFQSILFNSFFAASLALFEHKMSVICRQAQKAMGPCTTAESARSSFKLDRAKNFLKEIGVDFPAGDRDWEEITTYQKLRNYIMHGGADLSVEQDDKVQELLRYAERKQIARQWNGFDLAMTRLYCEEVIENLTQFFLKVHRAYEAWSKKAN